MLLVFILRTYLCIYSFEQSNEKAQFALPSLLFRTIECSYKNQAKHLFIIRDRIDDMFKTSLVSNFYIVSLGVCKNAWEIKAFVRLLLIGSKGVVSTCIAAIHI